MAFGANGIEYKKHSGCPGSSDPIYAATFYIKWTNSIMPRKILHMNWDKNMPFFGF